MDKKGYLTVEMDSGKEGGIILLRKAEGIQEWFQEMLSCWQEYNSREMETTKQFWSKQKLKSPDLSDWLLARQRVGEKYLYTTSTPRMGAKHETNSHVGKDLSGHGRHDQASHVVLQTGGLADQVPVRRRATSNRRRRPKSECKYYNVTLHRYVVKLQSKF